MSDREEYVEFPRSVLDQLLEQVAGGHDHDEKMHDAAVQEGRRGAYQASYRAGYDLGHDTGLSARQDSRPFVHGVMEGFTAGAAKQQQLARELRERGQKAPRPSAQRETEPEAGS